MDPQTSYRSPFFHFLSHAHSLLKSYRFKNFRTALAFTNSVGALAEEQKHHPRLITEWGSVEVGWWTHAIGGVSERVGERAG